MKKTILLAILLMCGVLSYAQQKEPVATTFTATSYTVHTTSLKALSTYNWDLITQVFKDNPQTTSITVTVFYDEDGVFEKIEGNDVFQEVSCTPKSLPSILAKMKTSFANTKG